MRLRFPLLLALASLASPALAGIRYVNVAQTTGANDGSSWADAFQGQVGLQSALAVAVPGDQIWVAQGTYQPALLGAPLVSIVLRTGVEIYGGFAGSETGLDQRDPAVHLTILSGDLAHNDGLHMYSDNSRHVVNGGAPGSTGLLDGFTIQAGYATMVGGGGLLCTSGCAPEIRGCIFRANHALVGGAVVIQASSPRFQFTCFEDNQASASAGAFYVEPGSVPSFIGCTFVRNRGGHAGAGVANTVFALRFTNCVFADNTAETVYNGSAGGALLLLSSTVAFEGCTIVGNRTLVGGCGGVQVWNGSAEVSNSIVYFNQGPSGGMTLRDNLFGASATWSCIQGVLSGTGNTSADPRFVSLASYDLHLNPTSPCCDAGNNQLIPTSGDLDADRMPRRADDRFVLDSGVGAAPIVDMGAFETRSPDYVPFCAGDGSLATACPCGNAGYPGHGCTNSDVFSIGALLAATGSAVPDTIELHGSELLSSVTCLFLQGDQDNASGIVFGDGVRCVAGSLKRLYVKTALSGLVQAPEAGDPSISARSAALGDAIAPGSLRWYQVYYHDPDPSFCPAPQGSASNSTNGVIVAW